MSLFSFFVGGSRRNHVRTPASMGSRFRPQVETLEVRDCPAVTIPTGLTLTAMSPTQVQIMWNPVAGATGYDIFEWNGTAQTQIGQVTAKTTTFVAGQLTAYHQYYFMVQAFDASTIADTAWASVITQQNAITAPTNVKVSAPSTTQLTLTWNAATGETGYHILQWNGVTWTTVGSTVAGVNVFTVSGLSLGQNYSFQVEAYNATNTAASAVVNGSTLGNSLTAVSKLTAQAISASTIQLNWSNSLGETGYHIYRWSSNAPTDQLVATLAANTVAYQDPNLQGGTTYWYYVQAYNGSSTVNSGWVNATTSAAPPLTAPTKFTGEPAGTNSVELTWNLASGALGYRIYAWTGFTWEIVETVAQNVQQVVINNLASDETHWFLVQSFNDTQVEDTSALFVNL